MDKLEFPVLVTTKHLDLIVWRMKRKQIGTILWEEKISDVKERKSEQYEELVNNCKEKGWELEYYIYILLLDATGMWIRRARYFFEISSDFNQTTSIKRSKNYKNQSRRHPSSFR